MNLLDSLYNASDAEIFRFNKKYLIIIVILLAIIAFFVTMKKKLYYENTFSVSENSLVLLVENDFVNQIKEVNKIIIDDEEYEYSVNNIEQVDNIFFISIELNTEIKNIGQNNYKIYIGKERLFDFIIRIIKK